MSTLGPLCHTVGHTNGATAFIHSVFNGAREAVEAYITSGGYVNVREITGNDRTIFKNDTGLLVAARHNNVEMAELLINNGAIVDLSDFRGRSSLYVSCENGNTDIARLFIDKGAELCTNNDEQRMHKTLLHVAAEASHVDVVNLLLDNCVDIDKIGPNKKTALHIASEMGHPATVQVLVERGANIDSRSDEKATPLYFACKLHPCCSYITLLTYS